MIKSEIGKQSANCNIEFYSISIIKYVYINFGYLILINIFGMRQTWVGVLNKSFKVNLVVYAKYNHKKKY